MITAVKPQLPLTYHTRKKSSISKEIPLTNCDKHESSVGLKIQCRIVISHNKDARSIKNYTKSKKKGKTKNINQRLNSVTKNLLK